jgi:hypothetical protein
LPRLSQVDRLILESQDHYYLDDQDKCFFVGEYTARGGFKFSNTNQLIYNLKKSPNLRGTNQWFYKEQAIVTAGRTLRSVLGTGGNELWLRNTTLVPIPPSKVEGDPLYDDRIFRVLCECGIGLKLDIRQLVHQRQAMLAAHESERRPRPREIADNYYIDEALAHPEPSAIGVFDDLLTTGCHFKAMKAVLNDRFPGVAVTGIFLARRVAETDDPNAET